MLSNNSLWAVIEQLRAEMEQIETRYENAMQSLQEVEIENAKQKQIIEDHLQGAKYNKSRNERDNREDKAEERRQHEKEQEEGDNHE